MGNILWKKIEGKGTFKSKDGGVSTVGKCSFPLISAGKKYPELWTAKPRGRSPLLPSSRNASLPWLAICFPQIAWLC